MSVSSWVAVGALLVSIATLALAQWRLSQNNSAADRAAKAQTSAELVQIAFAGHQHTITRLETEVAYQRAENEKCEQQCQACQRQVAELRQEIAMLKRSGS